MNKFLSYYTCRQQATAQAAHKATVGHLLSITSFDPVRFPELINSLDTCRHAGFVLIQ